MRPVYQSFSPSPPPQSSEPLPPRPPDLIPVPPNPSRSRCRDEHAYQQEEARQRYIIQHNTFAEACYKEALQQYQSALQYHREHGTTLATSSQANAPDSPDEAGDTQGPGLRAEVRALRQEVAELRALLPPSGQVARRAHEAVAPRPSEAARHG